VKEVDPGQESKISPISGMGKGGDVVDGEGQLGVLLCNKRLS
jgi:hypothetical protein